MYRSVYVIPIMIERENFEVGLYVTPFIKEKYDSFGNYQYDKILDSYLLNFRARLIAPTRYQKINVFVDFAYSDGNLYDWKDIRISWIEIGFYSRIGHTGKLLIGYKHNLDTNQNIDISGLFANIIFGHSFLIRK